jgi:hypothetical protein
MQVVDLTHLCVRERHQIDIDVIMHDRCANLVKPDTVDVQIYNIELMNP